MFKALADLLVQPASNQINWFTLPRVKYMLLSVLYLLSWMLLDVGIVQFETSPHITPWYPPPALSLTLLFVFGQRYTPVLLVGALLDELWWRPTSLDPFHLLVFALIQTAGYSVACFILQQLRIDLFLRRLSDVLWFLAVATLIAPMSIALLSVANFALAGLLPWDKYGLAVFDFWLGDAIGITMLTPFLLVCVQPYLQSLQRTQAPLSRNQLLHPSCWELLAQGISIILGLFIAFGSLKSRSLNFSYVSLLPIVWTAVRQGLPRTSAAILVTNVGATILLRVQGGDGFDLGVFQLYLLAVSQTGLLLGAVVTERKRVENNLRLTQNRLQHLISSGPAVIYSSKCSGDYGITFISENVDLLLGYKAQEFILDSSFWAQQIHPEDAGRVFIEFAEILWMQGHHTCEYRFLHQDGTYRWIEDQLKLILKPGWQEFELLGCWQDITERKQADAELYQQDKLLRGVAEATKYLLTDTDLAIATDKALMALGVAAGVDRVYIYENHPHPTTGEISMSMRFEWTRESVQPTINQLHWQNQPYSAFGMTRWYSAFAAGNSISGLVQEFPATEQEILCRDNIVSIQMVPILIDAQLWGYIGFDDCHFERRWSKSEESILVVMAASIGGALKRQRIEKQLVYNALHDPLTGLPNRAFLLKRMEHVLFQIQRHQNSMVAVLFLDLDRFKLVNDGLGHLVGDQLLLNIARILESCVKVGDTIARLGGDEFTILLEGIQNFHDATRIAERIQEKLRRPFNINGQDIFVTLSIGISLSTSKHEKPEDLLWDADIAMYRAKFLGRSRYEVFNPTMHTHAVSRLQLETDLRRALEREEFCVYYQSIVSLATNQIVGFEALVRWQHPRGLLLPKEFITVAEETGLIIPLGYWVLSEACRQLRCWQVQFPVNPPLTMSVNVSTKQLTETDLVAQVERILVQAGIDAQTLRLEITESAIIENNICETLKLSQLKVLGLHFSLDDFGTGYSSLNYLNRFPADMLKIDRSFVKNINFSQENLELVRTIIALAHNLNMIVTAEGVETLEQLTLLKELGCELGQGYLFSQPINSEGVKTLLSQELRHTT